MSHISPGFFLKSSYDNVHSKWRKIKMYSPDLELNCQNGILKFLENWLLHKIKNKLSFLKINLQCKQNYINM